ncbi:hypothetical protein FGO68_gene14349 [Halteria grandinella]|uniref:Uncharacterized protein n=1 Tax=Halteria grandinella TaxID=5974 RepID=A0A8J8T3U1_HALGN|nr:hypothetical protein FGO68_gene14349 [Halteria grandinella]
MPQPRTDRFSQKHFNKQMLQTVKIPLYLPRSTKVHSICFQSRERFLIHRIQACYLKLHRFRGSEGLAEFRETLQKGNSGA